MPHNFLLWSHFPSWHRITSITEYTFNLHSVCRHPHIQTFPQVFVSTHLFTILWTSVFPSFFGCSGLTGGEALSHSWADNVLSGDRSVNNGSSSRSLWNYIGQKHNHPQNVMEGRTISGSQGRQLFFSEQQRCFPEHNNIHIVLPN